MATTKQISTAETKKKNHIKKGETDQMTMENHHFKGRRKEK